MKNLVKELVMLNNFAIDFSQENINKEEIEKLKLIFFGNVEEENKDISFCFSIADRYFGILSDGTIFKNLDKYDFNRKNFSIELELYEVNLSTKFNFCNTLLIEEKQDELHVINFPTKLMFNGTQLIFNTYDYYVSKFIFTKESLEMERLYIFDNDKTEINDFDFQKVNLYEEFESLFQSAMMNNYYYVNEKLNKQTNVKIFFKNCYNEYDFIIHYLVYIKFTKVIEQGLLNIPYIQNRFNEVFSSSYYRFQENLIGLLNDESIKEFENLDSNIVEFLKLDIRQVSTLDKINSFMSKIEKYDLKEYLSYYINVKNVELTQTSIELIEEIFYSLENVEFTILIKFIFRYLNENTKKELINILYSLKKMINNSFQKELDFNKSFSDEYVRKFAFYKDINKKENNELLKKIKSLKTLSDL